MISAMDASLSALRSFGQSQDLRAGNIANVNTDGDRPLEGRPVEGPVGGVQLHVRPAAEIPSYSPDSPADLPLSGTDLAEETVGGMIDSAAWKASIQVARAADEMTGTILDLVG